MNWGEKKKKKIEVEQTHRNRKGDARQAGDASRRSHAAGARSAASCSGGTGRGVRLALTEGTAGGQLPGPGAHTSVRVWRRASGHAGDPPGARGARHLTPDARALRSDSPGRTARGTVAPGGCPQSLDGAVCERTVHCSCSTRRPRRCRLRRPLSPYTPRSAGPRRTAARRGRGAVLTSRPCHAGPALRGRHRGLAPAASARRRGTPGFGAGCTSSEAPGRGCDSGVDARPRCDLGQSLSSPGVTSHL